MNEVDTSPLGGDLWRHRAGKRIADVVGEETPQYEVSAADAEALLHLASVVAHDSGDRKNAPLIAYLVGVAKGRHPERSLEEFVTSVCGPQAG